mmetsp:Transcript_13622/g.20700  ORF Transcript_13622/g.20700 Transcript_13622/m.20700 type:complete len:93 (-) Transcript_13622:264-542(-)|eukprot:CAMPEP_0206393018 /NCGR_PEP_ID=MMETSP0294-20121207/20412_1 /ASSEMBLY_ACC=CAM_ASM_000327 /TAXON_ID=39354 /ORGANISM="Heterosigma akashiwo, Strain CCMP2393" /LENGTH=92 /DNA_ID=CAMNT_0053846423 /DNA_START=176 /DNA_END=454 /DNA_ORIENTATION=+
MGVVLDDDFFPMIVMFKEHEYMTTPPMMMIQGPAAPQGVEAKHRNMEKAVRRALYGGGGGAQWSVEGGQVGDEGEVGERKGREHSVSGGRSI